MKITTLSFLLVAITQVCLGQNPPARKWQNLPGPDQSQHYFVRVDTLSGDTAKYFRNSRRYVEVSRDGVMLVDGHQWGGMGTACGCEALPHGYWIERYRDGGLKEQGRYFCSKKMGTWIYYYPNGQLMKIENYATPYPEPLTEVNLEYLDMDNLRKVYLLEGPYLEYYPNGQLKVEGEYQIVEEFSTVDSFFTFDPETYELVINEKKGEFWIPKSIKTGHWNTYSETGSLISHAYFENKIWKDDRLRAPGARFWEVMTKLMEYEEAKKE